MGKQKTMDISSTVTLLLIGTSLRFISAQQASECDNLVHFVGTLNQYSTGAKAGTLVWRYRADADIKWIRCFYQRDGRQNNKIHIFSHDVITKKTFYYDKLESGGNFTLDKGLFRLIVPYPNQETENVYTCQIVFGEYDEPIWRSAFLSEEGIGMLGPSRFTAYFESGDKDITLNWNYEPDASLSQIRCFFQRDIRSEAIHLISHEVSSKVTLQETFKERNMFSVSQGSIKCIIVNPTSEDEGYYIIHVKYKDTNQVKKSYGTLKRTVILQSINGRDTSCFGGDMSGNILWELIPPAAHIKKIICYKKSYTKMFEFVYKFFEKNDMYMGYNDGPLKDRAQAGIVRGYFVLAIERPKYTDQGRYLCLFNSYGAPERPHLAYSKLEVKAPKVKINRKSDIDGGNKYTRQLTTKVTTKVDSTDQKGPFTASDIVLLVGGSALGTTFSAMGCYFFWNRFRLRR